MNALRAPETPAFHALGLGSEDVQRPATPFPTTLAVANGLANGKFIVPFQNLGLEFAPYWMQRRPDVTREFMEAHRGKAWYRNFTVSLALTHAELEVRDDAGEVTEQDTALGAIGMRTTLWPGEPSEVAVRCQAFLIEQSRRDATAVGEDQSWQLAVWEKANPPPEARDYPVPDEPSLVDPKYVAGGTFDKALYDRDIQEWTAKRDSAFASNNAALVRWDRERQEFKNKALREYNASHPIVETAAKARCRRLIHERRGFVVDLAAAHVVRAADADLGRLDDVVEGGQTTAEWLTLGLLGQNYSALGVVRLRQNTGATKDTFDGGARLIAAWNRFGVSLEGTYRRLLDANSEQDQFRAALGVDYRLDGGMWVRTVFGKDFRVPNNDAPIIALANLQWSFGLDRGVTPDRIGGEQ